MMRKQQDPITFLQEVFPWPENPPDVPKNMTGWFAHPKQILLEEVIPKDTKIILELGSWLGQSTRWFLKNYPSAIVIAVDTWLGSCEHIQKKAHILPTLYEAFLVNNWEWRDRLVPFRNTSLAALNFLSQIGVIPDVVYFDSDHSRWGLLAELETVHELFPNAMMVGDDFEKENSVWRSVIDFATYGDCRGGTKWRGWLIVDKNYTWYIDKELSQ